MFVLFVSFFYFFLVHDKNISEPVILKYINDLSQGLPPLKPDLLFVLKQKVSKKFKTTPASPEKLALSWLKPSKLAPSSLKQDSFLCQLHLFFGSPDEVNPCN